LIPPFSRLSFVLTYVLSLAFYLPSSLRRHQIGFWGQRCSGQSWTNPALTIVSREPTAPGIGAYGARTTLPLRSLQSALPPNFVREFPPLPWWSPRTPGRASTQPRARARAQGA